LEKLYEVLISQQQKSFNKSRIEFLITSTGTGSIMKNFKKFQPTHSNRYRYSERLFRQIKQQRNLELEQGFSL
jgi:hypothetical protein